MSQDLQIAVMAALAALSGVIISQAISLVLSLLDKKHAKKVLLRQKYEEMMCDFHDSLAYVKDVQTCNNLEQLYQLSSSPKSGKASVLALLYFPELVDPLERYSIAQSFFYNSVVSIFDERIPANAGAQAVLNKEHMQVLQRLVKEKDSVIELLTLNAQKYTKA